MSFKAHTQFSIEKCSISLPITMPQQSSRSTISDLVDSKWSHLANSFMESIFTIHYNLL